mmetsp:Transcript_33810/g.30632  ORF Transcript_33810/g.30632 Transcript_33810/m.30632 type:complete len:138 (+) Transcript_33810:996-1409(+)
MLILIHLFFGFLNDQERPEYILIPFMMMGVWFALYNTLIFACVSDLVSQKIISSCFGLIMSGENLGMAIGPIIVGELLPEGETVTEREYDTVSFTLAAISGLSFILAIFLWKHDRDSGSVLQRRNTFALERPRTTSI